MNELQSVPLNLVLPSLIPIVLERGEAGYLDAPAIAIEGHDGTTIEGAGATVIFHGPHDRALP